MNTRRTVRDPRGTATSVRVRLAAIALGLLSFSGAPWLEAGGRPPASGQDAVQSVPSGIVIHVLNPEDAKGAGTTTVEANRARTAAPRSAAGAVVQAASAGQATGLLTITALFDSSITADANAASIEAAINTAIANIQSQFNDPITVTILFREVTTGLGQSDSYFFNVHYKTVINALRGDATTTDDASTIALLPSASTNPVDGTAFTSIKPANLRAVGINQFPPADCVGFGLAVACDGVVQLNTTLTTPGSPGSSLQYALVAVAEHEIDEVLGLGSGVGLLPSAAPEDLFRYDANGNRYYSTADSRQSPFTRAYFSLNGSAQIAEFDNQNDGGDFGDWQSNPLRAGVAAKVQDAFASPSSTAPALSAELRALDVIGYDALTGVTGPTITGQPGSPSIPYLTSTTLTVTASGSGLSYQWYNGQSPDTSKPIGGAMTSSYTTPLLAGDSHYWVKVSNSGGSANSNSSLVTVNFTDPSLTAGASFINKQHWDEVASRINAQETIAGQPTTTFRALTAGTTMILLQDYTDRRAALNNLFSLFALTPVWHSNPMIGSTIGVVEMNDLRANVHTLEDR